MAPKRDVYPEPQNVTLIQIRVFVDLIEVKISRWDHSRLGQVLNPMTSIFIRNRKEGDSEREGPLNMGAEIEDM